MIEYFEATDTPMELHAGHLGTMALAIGRHVEAADTRGAQDAWDARGDGVLIAGTPKTIRAFAEAILARLDAAPAYKYNTGQPFADDDDEWEAEARFAEYQHHHGTPKTDEAGAPVTAPATCGVCGLTWDDAIITFLTPTPAGRCPFEHIHNEITDDGSHYLREQAARMESIRQNNTGLR